MTFPSTLHRRTVIADLTQSPDAVRRYIEETGLAFDVLLDERREVVRAYGVGTAWASTPGTSRIPQCSSSSRTAASATRSSVTARPSSRLPRRSRGELARMSLEGSLTTTRDRGSGIRNPGSGTRCSKLTQPRLFARACTRRYATGVKTTIAPWLCLGIALPFMAGGLSGAGAPASQAAAAPARGTTTKVVGAANAFLASLSADQRTKASFDFTSSQRTGWSNLPTGIFEAERPQARRSLPGAARRGDGRRGRGTQPVRLQEGQRDHGWRRGPEEPRRRTHRGAPGRRHHPSSRRPPGGRLQRLAAVAVAAAGSSSAGTSTTSRSLVRRHPRPRGFSSSADTTSRLTSPSSARRAPHAEPSAAQARPYTLNGTDYPSRSAPRTTRASP